MNGSTESYAIWIATAFGVVFLITRSLISTLVFAALVVLALGLIINLHKRGFFSRKSTAPRKKKTTFKRDTNTVALGTCVAGKVKIHQYLQHMGHTFVVGITRSGKTTMIYSMIHDMLSHHSPSELMIGFSDAKQVSFNIYRSTRHLFCPVATSRRETEEMIKMALAEVNRRLGLFSSQKGKICTNVDEYRAISGESLPRIVLFFDELADSIAPDSEAESMLTSIAKMGLATGIHLILSTQRPTKHGISHEVQSQCSTIMCAKMKSSREYAIASVPQVVYQDMVSKKGLFIVYSPELSAHFSELSPQYGGWGFVQGDYVSAEELESVAREVSSGEPQSWAGLLLPDWGGSSDDKLGAIYALEESLGHVPSRDDIVSAYNVSRKTASLWYNKAYDRGNISG